MATKKTKTKDEYAPQTYQPESFAETFSKLTDSPQTGEKQTALTVPPKKIGRPSKYTPELANEICERLSEGEPLRQICRDDHMPAWQKIYEWMQKDESLSGAIARAREVGQDAIAEDILREMDQKPERILSKGGGRIDSGYVQLIKARADVKLKLLAKWNPKRYGDNIKLSGDPENPLQMGTAMLDAFVQKLELKAQAANAE
jgi:hypothetical protein